MARVRVLLLGPLADLAHLRQLEVAARNVDEALAQVRDRFGPEFARLLERARPFLNGEMVETTTSLGDNDELALVPPVSGG